MAQKYISDSTFSLQIRLLLALEYVPENHVIDAFEELIDSQHYTKNENILRPLIDYFEDTWIGRTMGRKKFGDYQSIQLFYGISKYLIAKD